MFRICANITLYLLATALYCAAIAYAIHGFMLASAIAFAIGLGCHVAVKPCS